MDNMGMLQIKIYTRKFFRTLRRESIISIIIGIIITLLVMTVTQKNFFEPFRHFSLTSTRKSTTI